MSRKFPIQKRQVAGFGGYAGMITAYPIRTAPMPTVRRRRPTSRRVARTEAGMLRPTSLLAALLLGVAVVGVGLLGWQVQQSSATLSQEKFEQDGLTRANRELSSRREQLLVRDNIVRRGASLGLYPARPDQIRTIVNGK